VEAAVDSSAGGHPNALFLEAVERAGIEVTPGASDGSESNPMLSGWTWELGDEVCTFLHPGQQETQRSLRYRSRIDAVGIRIAVSGGVGHRYRLENSVVDSSDLDIILIYMPRGAVMESEGPFRGRAVSLIMDLAWLSRTLGERDPFIRLLAANDGGLIWKVPQVTGAIPRLFSELANSSSASHLARRLLFRAKSLELLSVSVDLIANSHSSGVNLSTPSREESRLAECAMKHIASHLNTDLSANALARQIGTNRTTLRDAFRRVTGRTMVRYKRECRMEFAETLLQNERLSVAEIAYRTGYSDAASFCVAYREYFGRTPREARHQPSAPRYAARAE